MDLRREIRNIIISEMRDMGDPTPLEIKKPVNIPGLPGWTMQQVKYEVEHLQENTYEWVWEIMDSDGEVVGALLEDGTLNYYDEDGEWNRAGDDDSFKGNPKLAATLIWLKRQKPVEHPEEEPQMASEAEGYESVNKARDGFVRTDTYVFPDVDGYKVFVDEMTPETARKGRYKLPFKLASIIDSKNNYVGHVAVTGAVYYTKPGSDTLQLKTHLKVKFDEMGLKNAARLVYLTRQQPIGQVSEETEQSTTPVKKSYKINGIPILDVFPRQSSADAWKIYLNGPGIYKQQVLGKFYEDGLLKHASRLFQNDFEFKENKLGQHDIIGAIHTVWEGLEKITLPDINGLYAFKVADTPEWLFMTYGSDTYAEFMEDTGKIQIRTVKGSLEKAKTEDFNNVFPNNPLNALRYYYLKTQKTIHKNHKK